MLEWPSGTRTQLCGGRWALAVLSRCPFPEKKEVCLDWGLLASALGEELGLGAETGQVFGRLNPQVCFPLLLHVHCRRAGGSAHRSGLGTQGPSQLLVTALQEGTRPARTSCPPSPMSHCHACCFGQSCGPTDPHRVGNTDVPHHAP